MRRGMLMDENTPLGAPPAVGDRVVESTGKRDEGNGAGRKPSLFNVRMQVVAAVSAALPGPQRSAPRALRAPRERFASTPLPVCPPCDLPDR